MLDLGLAIGHHLIVFARSPDRVRPAQALFRPLTDTAQTSEFRSSRGGPLGPD